MKKMRVAEIMAVATLALGCGGQGKKAPTTPQGKPIVVHVEIDRGTPGRAVLPGQIPEQATAEERDRFASWMEHDLVAMLNQAGYRAVLRQGADRAETEPGGCALKIALVSHIPADRASRTEAGLGEGVVAVEIAYELYTGQGEKVRRLFSNTRAMSSGRSWEWLAHALNEKIAADVTRRLSETVR